MRDLGAGATLCCVVTSGCTVTWRGPAESAPKERTESAPKERTEQAPNERAVIVEPSPPLTHELPPASVRALDGRLLPAPEFTESTRRQFEENLRSAFEAHRARPDDLETAIWFGRRTAYLGDYHGAIRIYTRALGQHPVAPELYRHRGHRYISVRRFAQAIADLERAVELIADAPDRTEPDGLPNARGIPTSTLHTNIYYHLGLARYLTGDFDGAARAYSVCRAKSKNPDMLAATMAWEYAALARAGRLDEARASLSIVDPDWDIIENHAYHQLLLVYRGDRSLDEVLAAARRPRDDDAIPDLNFASTAYGLANHLLVSGSTEEGLALCHEISRGEAWASFGAIAAEVELHRRPTARRRLDRAHDTQSNGDAQRNGGNR